MESKKRRINEAFGNLFSRSLVLCHSLPPLLHEDKKENTRPRLVVAFLGQADEESPPTSSLFEEKYFEFCPPQLKLVGGLRSFIGELTDDCVDWRYILQKKEKQLRPYSRLLVTWLLWPPAYFNPSSLYAPRLSSRNLPLKTNLMLTMPFMHMNLGSMPIYVRKKCKKVTKITKKVQKLA